MSNVIANSIDWYIDKLNKKHIIPANAAALIRDVSAKNLGDENFVPRKLTADNFTDAELDALYQLASNGSGGGVVDDQSYLNMAGIQNGVDKKGKGISHYLSPLGVIETTIGKANSERRGDDLVIKDIYDFNEKYSIPPKGDESLYLKIRRFGSDYGHRESDPHKNKILTDIPLSEINKRLGNNIYKSDITTPPKKSEVVKNTARAGLSLGVPAGAVAGTVVGALGLIKAKNRKNWLRNMLKSIAIGSVAGAAIGGGGAALAANHIYQK